MTGGTRRLSLGVLAAALLGASIAVSAQTAVEGPAVAALFADASAKETAVRNALAAPAPALTLLKAVRNVVQDYETIVRRYPVSSYGDDALWRAAQVSADAFREFRDPQEQTAALRLLRQLDSQYPSNPFAKQTAAVVAALGAVSSVTAPSSPPPIPNRAVKATIGKVATITDIRRASLVDVVRVVIELDREVAFHDERIDNPARVFVDLTATDTTKALRDQTLRFDGDGDLVRQVRLGRHPNNTTRVVLDAADISSYSVYPLYNPFRLVIDCLRSRPAGPATRSPEPARPQTPTAEFRPTTRPVEPSWAGSLPSTTPATATTLREAVGEPLPPPSAPPAPAPAPAPSLPASPSVREPSRNIAGGFSTARQLGLGVSRIVVDPGHGGHDPGARGNGATEAEFVLDVALRLERLLEKTEGVEVVLTRRSDDYVSLQERTAIANRENADLFLSIHANASNIATVRGVETYFLNFATNLSAATVAARENAASGQTMGELPDMVKTIALNSKLDESKDFATYVQRALVAKLRPLNKTVRDLGVKQAPFVVLIGAAMPSVLAEVAFVTNPQEARLVKSSGYRQKIAEALSEAVRKYQFSLKRVSTVAQQP